MQRRSITVRGVVQGVGFRPFVYALAHHLGLSGFVLNRAGGVRIEVEGVARALDDFLARLRGDAPPLARIDAVEWEQTPTRGGSGFTIEASTGGPGQVFVSPDAATCADCLRELLDPADRRYRYPFLNCTNCGPRLTIVRGAPYDRERTTMAAFRMCPLCRAEYDDPADRRFHAQPTCCPVCGPRLTLRDAAGNALAAGDPLAHFAAALRSGRVGAIKGLGGYHLTCDATNADAVAALRRRKHRDEKPFAVMVRDVEAAAALAEIGPGERDLLASAAAPIVLLRRRPGAAVADRVAPGNPHLGVLLPYTPLHHLLLREVGTALVMTSGNRADEPIATDDADAVRRLAGIADLFLTHDRPIQVRCDDSVSRWVDGAELPLRRSRGHAPRPVALPVECRAPVLAVGGHLKTTFALGEGRQAFLSHHIGDLDHLEAYQAFVRDIELYEELFAVRPAFIAHDLHPDYASTRYAARRGLPLIAVQHHHAHMAACMAEHGRTEPVIGVSFDGTGYGTDGAVWGGEFLVGDCRGFRRAAHLRYVPMPGGEQAVREPWRMALAHLKEAEIGCERLTARLPAGHVRAVTAMIERRVRCPLTSSAGRLFDAVASLAGVRDRVTYEGQAAVELGWLADDDAAAGTYPFEIADLCGTLVVDPRSLIAAVAVDSQQGVSPAVIARRFHATMADLIVRVCVRLRDAGAPDAVTLSGGVFLNARLASEVAKRLRAEGFRVYRHQQVPPGDGGLCLGQLAVAAHALEGERDVPRDPRAGGGDLP